MIFGEGVRAAVTVESAGWIAPATRGRPGTVGSLVPDAFESVLRLHPPPPDLDDWWDAYRRLYEVIAAAGARHTARPDLAWFAIWEGHGFANAATRIAWHDPPADDVERLAREAEREQLRVEDQRRNAAIRAALGAIPTFDLPHRRHLLVEGPVIAVSGLRDPAGDHWRNPDLFWPDDCGWFVATDVDIWSVYVAGDASLIDELAAAVPTPSERVTLDDSLPVED